MPAQIGQVSEVTGSNIKALMDAVQLTAAQSGTGGDQGVTVGSMVEVQSGTARVLGIVSAIRSAGSDKGAVMDISLVGQFVPGASGGSDFKRGVARWPAIGSPVLTVAEADAVGRYEFRDASVPFQSPSTTSKPRAALIVSGEAPGKRIAWSEPRRVIEVEASRPDIPVALDVTFVESSALRFKPELFDAEGRPTGDIPLYDRR